MSKTVSLNIRLEKTSWQRIEKISDVTGVKSKANMLEIILKIGLTLKEKELGITECVS